jgi:transposase
VEQRFRFLKSPYFVGPRPKRVQAFSWVMLLVLLVYSYLQQALRVAMKKEEEPLILPGKRKSHQPTGVAILE